MEKLLTIPISFDSGMLSDKNIQSNQILPFTRDSGATLVRLWCDLPLFSPDFACSADVTVDSKLSANGSNVYSSHFVDTPPQNERRHYGCKVIGHLGTDPFRFYDAAKELPGYNQPHYESAGRDLTV